MKSNAKCWTPPATALLIAMLWLSGCATDGSDRPGQLSPPVVEFSVADRAQAADNVETISKASIVVRMLSDYAVLREQARACR